MRERQTIAPQQQNVTMAVNSKRARTNTCRFKKTPLERNKLINPFEDIVLDLYAKRGIENARMGVKNDERTTLLLVDLHGIFPTFFSSTDPNNNQTY